MSLRNSNFSIFQFLVVFTYFNLKFLIVNSLYSSSDDYVMQITDSTFSSKILNADGPALVEFFTPWCGR